MPINQRVTLKQLFCFLSHFDPGGHDEDFYHQAKHMVDEGLGHQECLDILSSYVGYKVGDDPEFDRFFEELFDPTFSDDLEEILESFDSWDVVLDKSSFCEPIGIDYDSLYHWIQNIMVEQSASEVIHYICCSYEPITIQTLLDMMVRCGYVMGSNKEFEEVLPVIFGETCD